MIAFLTGLLIGALVTVIFLWKKNVVDVTDINEIIESDDEEDSNV